MKLFISQPMRGKSMNEILAERKALIADAATAMRTDEITVLDTLFQDNESALCCLGRSLMKLSEADVAIFASGWENARGCRIEHQAALEYGIKTIID